MVKPPWIETSIESYTNGCWFALVVDKLHLTVAFQQCMDRSFVTNYWSEALIKHIKESGAHSSWTKDGAVGRQIREYVKMAIESYSKQIPDQSRKVYILSFSSDTETVVCTNILFQMNNVQSIIRLISIENMFCDDRQKTRKCGEKRWWKKKEQKNNWGEKGKNKSSAG